MWPLHIGSFHLAFYLIYLSLHLKSTSHGQHIIGCLRRLDSPKADAKLEFAVQSKCWGQQLWDEERWWSVSRVGQKKSSCTEVLKAPQPTPQEALVHMGLV